MIAEALARLRGLNRLDAYRYVGFGGLYFSDFLVMHRALGIKTMTSIEKPEAEDAEIRFTQNLPYRTIMMDFSPPADVLHTLSDDQPVIAWLDYEDRINDITLGDVSEFTSRARDGSVIIVTLNAHVDQKTVQEQGLLTDLRDAVGADKVPGETTEKSLRADWGLAETTRQLIIGQIGQTLVDRNGVSENPLQFKQMFNFRYRDSTRMVTVGGLLYRRSQEAQVAGCDLDDVHFLRNASDAYEIRIPKLTPREIRRLDQLLPESTPEELLAGADSLGIPPEDARTYAGIYRYFPSFTEVEP